MSRFVLIHAVAGGPPNTPYQKFRPGTTIADSSGNAVAGDIVWAALAAAPCNAMAPLDASGAAAMVAAAAANPGALGGWCTVLGGALQSANGADCN
jgi:hypothetical protein